MNQNLILESIAVSMENLSFDENNAKFHINRNRKVVGSISVDPDNELKEG